MEILLSRESMKQVWDTRDGGAVTIGGACCLRPSNRVATLGCRFQVVTNQRWASRVEWLA